MSVRRVPTADGVELALHRLRAYRDGRPALLLVHGAFANHRLWLHDGADRASGGGLAHFLGAAGFDVWLADLRHHGESPRQPAGAAWTFEDWVLRDAPALVTRISDETNGAPLGWVGHSAGGAAGLCWVARYPTASSLGAIVTFGTPGPRRVGALRRILAGSSAALAGLLGRFPARALGFGSEDEAGGILAQWMQWNVRGGWPGRDGFDYFAALSSVRTPYLAVAGESDRVFAPPAACSQVIQQVGAERKLLVVEPGLSHRGMVLARGAREGCWPRVASWLKETLTAGYIATK